MSTPTRVATLIGSKVVDANGTSHGKVIDIVVSADGDHRLLELVVGNAAWLERLNMSRLLTTWESRGHNDRIPWRRIDRVEGTTIVISSSDTAAS